MQLALDSHEKAHAENVALRYEILTYEVNIMWNSLPLWHSTYYDIQFLVAKLARCMLFETHNELSLSSNWQHACIYLGWTPVHEITLTGTHTKVHSSFIDPLVQDQKRMLLWWWNFFNNANILSSHHAKFENFWSFANFGPICNLLPSSRKHCLSVLSVHQDQMQWFHGIPCCGTYDVGKIHIHLQLLFCHALLCGLWRALNVSTQAWTVVTYICTLR